MKAKLTILVGGFLFVATSNRSFADFGIEDVSQASAKELGVTFRTYPNGQAGTTVRMKFKNAGKLKDFDRIEVIVGDKVPPIVTARLHVSHPKPGISRADFSADPAYLPKSMLWIYVYDQPLGGTVYQFELKKFLEPVKTR